MIKLAHRGYSAQYPENTMEAFVKAYEKGFDGIETDVQMSKDGELVLIHDEKINRTSTGKGYVKDYRLDELKQYNYNYHFYGTYEIPTLKELLLFIKDKDFIVNLEIKTDVIEYLDIEKKVVELVKQYGVEKQVLYSSFHLESVLKLKELGPNAYVGYLIENHYPKKRQILNEYHIKAIHPKYSFISEKNMKDFKQNHIQVAVWTVKNLKEYERLKDLGVDIIISNEYFK